MKYMTVASTGTGTPDDPYRPDLPADVPFVGRRDGSGSYFLAVPDASAVPAKGERVELRTARARTDALTLRGIRDADVALWKV